MDIDLAAIARRTPSAPRRARVVDLPTIKPTMALTADLAAIYMRLIREWQRIVAEIIMPAYTSTIAEVRDGRFTDAMKISDDLNDIRNASDAGGEAANRLLSLLPAELERWILRFERWHRLKWSGYVATPTGVDLATLIGPEDVRETMETVLARNIALIRSVSDQTRSRIADTVFRGFQQRTPTRTIAREIAESVDMSRRRALNIAIDQTVKLSSALDTERMQQAGISEWTWRHSGKLHYRPAHLARNGHVYSFANPPPDMPGELPYCFPSGQPIGVNDDVIMAWRRFHRGELTKFVSDKGAAVGCTPNHPILTSAGWRPAKDIEVGDYVVCTSARGLNASHVDIEQGQPAIGDVFAAAQAVFASVATDGQGGEFHGDATVNEQIDIVDCNDGLRRHLVTSGAQDVVEFFLENATVCLAAADRHRASFPRFSTASGSPDGGMGMGDLFGALLWRQLSPNDQSGLACIADIHARLSQTGDERWTRHTETLRKRLGGLSTLIGADRFRAIELLSAATAFPSRRNEAAPNAEILGERIAANPGLAGDQFEGCSALDLDYSRVEHVVTEPWEGHVFNLETECGWYSAGTVAVKNCGCKKQARLVIDGAAV